MPATPTGLHLRVYNNDQSVQVYALTKPITLIGRSRMCDIVIHDESISRTHARIVQTNEQTYTLEDLGSTNGTYLRGYPVVGEVIVQVEDEIILGDGILAVLQEGDYELSTFEDDDLSGETQVVPPTRQVDMTKYRRVSLEELSPSDEG